MTTTDHARDLLARGLAPIPVPFKSKAPSIPRWPDLRLSEADLPEHFNGSPSNIGMLCGEPSAWIVDIDLDHPEAVALADAHLPPTGAIFGRPGKPRSHRLYRLTTPTETKKWTSPAGVLLELRSTGCQTIAPGSVHPSGEAVAWADDGEPATIDPADLIAACENLARAVKIKIGEADDRPARPSTAPRGALHGSATSYARAALEREAGAVCAAPEGTRNDRLNAAAFNIGTLIGAGELDRGEAESTLLSAARACGLGEHEARSTIRSGVDSGERHPRDRTPAKPGTDRAGSTTPRGELLTIRSLGELGPAEPPDWIWPGYIARGAITLFTGLWKAGKTTLLAHLLRDIRRGGGLVDGPTDCGVLILSEEPAGLWANRRDDLDLDPEIRIAHRATLARPGGPEWTRIIGEIVREIEKGTYGLVIVDTLASWWPVVNENDAGEMGEALAPLRAISNAGAGLLLCHHPRKGDGQHATATRGSGALPGFVDLIVELRRYSTDDAEPDTRRRLTAYGRFDGTPDERVLDLGPDGYTIVGGVAEARADDIRATIAEILPDDGPGLTLEEVRDNWPGTPPGKNRVRAMLNEGANHERWGRSGTGVKGDPIRFGPLGRGPAESNPSPPMRGENGRIFDSAYPHP